MTIEELFQDEKISFVDVSNIADESTYWNSSSTFILSVWARDVESLTAKQALWAEKILESMVERRIEGRL